METTTHWSSIGVRIFPEVGVMREREREREREKEVEKEVVTYFIWQFWH